MKKLFIIVIVIIVNFSFVRAHPDGSTPYWYPSIFIYGFISGCTDTIEVNQAPMTTKLWPSEVRAVCGCVVDSLRHSVTFFEASDNSSEGKTQLIVETTFPVCVEQIKQGKNE